MQGVSRGSQIEVRNALQAALDSGVDWGRLSDELFGIVGALDSSHLLRRSLADPSRKADAKRGLAARLLETKVAPATLEVVHVAVSQRWSNEKDLPNALEEAAIEAQIAMAQAATRADEVEEQLFRFERTVAATPELREALADRRLPAERKVQVVQQLLADKAFPETIRLARQAVLAPRGKRFAQVIEDYLKVAERRREQLSAVATVAQPLTDGQRDRLAALLSRIYSAPVLLNVVLDPQVLGGIRVQIGDDVIDGTIIRRLDEARRLMGS